MLLAAGADVNQKDRYGSTPLHTACSTGDVEVVEALPARRGAEGQGAPASSEPVCSPPRPPAGMPVCPPARLPAHSRPFRARLPPTPTATPNRAPPPPHPLQ